MSVICCVYHPEYLVFGADSRLTDIHDGHVITDQAEKIFPLSEDCVAVYCNRNRILDKSVHQFLHEFEQMNESLDAQKKAQLLQISLKENNEDTVLFLAQREKGTIYLFEISKNGVIWWNKENKAGLIWREPSDVLHRLFNSEPRLLISYMDLSAYDASDLAEFVCGVCINADRFTTSGNKCGGKTDVYLLSLYESRFLKRK